MTTEEMIAALQKQDQERVDRCAVALRELLALHGCTLTTAIRVTEDGRLVAEVKLMAK